MKRSKGINVAFRVNSEEYDKIEKSLKKLSSKYGFDIKWSQFARKTILTEVEKILKKKK